jgi:hypothetical protein
VRRLQPFLDYNFKHGYMKSQKATDADTMSASLGAGPAIRFFVKVGTCEVGGRSFSLHPRVTFLVSNHLCGKGGSKEFPIWELLAKPIYFSLDLTPSFTIILQQLDYLEGNVCSLTT